MTGHNVQTRRKVNFTKATANSEVWMEIRDLKKLLTLMTINEVSQRDLAKIAGYESHTHMGRVLRGETKTLPVERAVRIAHYFGAAIDDLFVTRVSSPTGETVRPQRQNRTMEAKAGR